MEDMQHVCLCFGRPTRLVTCFTGTEFVHEGSDMLQALMQQGWGLITCCTGTVFVCEGVDMLRVLMKQGWGLS